MKQIKLLLLSILSLYVLSCETTDLDVNINPNALNPEQADPTFLLNSIQTGFVGQSIGLHFSARGIVRHVNMFGTYANNTPPGALNGSWASTYQLAANVQFLETLGQTQNLANHIGIAQVLEAFAYINIVDFLGEAVFTEALNPDISNPSFDSGSSIYDAMFLQLDEAIANINTSDQIPFEDLFYNGDLSKWVKLANTLKIKMYVQSRLSGNVNATADINAIVASGNYISSPDDDFFAQFGTNNSNPDIRHPDFVGAYQTGAGGVYMSNEFMNILLNDKSERDPRLNYYIYRQTLADQADYDPGGALLPCDGDANFTFCYLGDGYWGREHADTEGIPNDGSQRATFGVYPAGGSFDGNIDNLDAFRTAVQMDFNNLTPEQVQELEDESEDLTAQQTYFLQRLPEVDNVSTVNMLNQNSGGAGIYPIILSSFVNFWLAEASLPAPNGLGISGSTDAYLTNALSDSFFRVGTVAGMLLDTADVTDYTNEVSANLTGAASDAERLEIIVNEFFIASWGNSVEAYNNVRRTGFPDLGGPVLPGTDYPRNFLVPESELTSNENPSVVQISRTDQVFWDTNPAGFIE